MIANERRLPADVSCVVGADGCPGGWIASVWDGTPGAEPEITLCTDFAALFGLAMERKSPVLAVDVPIGLPDRVGPGGRPCDVAARKVLGARQSAVFSVPSRTAVHAEDYPSACAAALASSDPPRKVSKQCFNIFPKIREVDGFLLAAGAECNEAGAALCRGIQVVECHPEVAFWAMNAEQSVPLPKKVKSRPSPEGLAFRLALLANAGGPGLDGLARSDDHGGQVGRLCSLPRRLVGDDDVIDAAACAWSAARVLTGVHRRFPSDGGVDGLGLPMVICG